MKRKSKVALLTNVAFAMLLLATFANAQHCPYDGGSMIVVQLTDADDKPLFGSAADLTLREVDNPEADSCSFTKGLLSRAFLPPVDAFQQRYERHGFENFSTYCEDCAFNADGYYAVILGQSEQSCMIKKDDDTDYRYVKRKFEVLYKRDAVEQTIKVSPDKVYSMCTGNGKWSRFQPIKLRLDTKPKAAAVTISLNKTMLLNNPQPLREKFDPTRDAKIDLVNAVKKAADQKKRIILDVGGEWCGWCVYMDKFFVTNTQLALIRDENFVWVKINMSPENENILFLSQFPEIKGYPHLFVLDDAGKLLHSQDTVVLESGDGYDIKRFTDFLQAWAPKKVLDAK